jgi:hypothetical protein
MPGKAKRVQALPIHQWSYLCVVRHSCEIGIILSFKKTDAKGGDYQ